MKNLSFLLLILLVSCSQSPKTVIPAWAPYDESAELTANADHESAKMRFTLIQSRVLDKNSLLEVIASQLSNFGEEDYLKISTMIYNQDIPTIQSHIKSGELTYEKLTQWYLYRIAKYENDRDKYLNAIISISPNAVNEARERDRERSDSDHPLYGMPVLIKDNVNVEGMATTAGAVAFAYNFAGDAYIIKRIKAKGGIILGKTNLSEWANFLSRNCPNGYSAVGGQTLNAYGRKMFDTGGSSSGSAVSMAANYAAAAVGTETSGSILSPSGKSSLAGLKPTVGLLSRGGIVPISSTYDTPGPMTRNITDNAILLSAMTGRDEADKVTESAPDNKRYWEELGTAPLSGLRFGVIKGYLRDSLYNQAIEKIRSVGGITIEIEPQRIAMNSFSKVLGADMKVDLPDYVSKFGGEEIKYGTISEIVDFNNQDSLIRIPYSQTIFTGMLKEEMSSDELAKLKDEMHAAGVGFFESPMNEFNLDAILSISNYNAGQAAVAHFPCLTVPMGYTSKGEPSTLTFIARPFEEDKLLKMGYAFEQATKLRQAPEGYR